MTTKPASVGMFRGFYDSAYDAFTNYMNILGDFIKRVQDLFPVEVESDELNALYTTIHNQGKELAVKDNEISRLRARLEKYEPAPDVEDPIKAVAEEPKPKVSSKKSEVKKAPAKKSPAKKAPAKTAPKKAEPKKETPKKAAPKKATAKAPAKKSKK